jgi:hypothetical protein
MLAPMRRLLLAVAILAVLAAVPAFAKTPAGGHYAGRGAIFTGQGAAKSALPVAFILSGRKIRSLTLGPAKVECEGSGSQSVIRFPKLTGFPAEPLTDGADNEYDYYFKEVSGRFRSIGNQVAETGTNLYATVNAWFPTGNSFLSHGGIDIQFNADADGTPDPAGPLACSGSWDGTFAKRV